MMITTEGIIIQMPANEISNFGRITSGVKLISLDQGVRVAKVAKVRKEATQTEGEDEEQPSIEAYEEQDGEVTPGIEEHFDQEGEEE
jgi:DNA gyrase subunit A